MTIPVRKTRRREPKVLGYILDPVEVFEQSVKDGTAVNNQMFATFMTYRQRITRHCGIAFNDIAPVYLSKGSEPYYCVVVAKNVGGQATEPRLDVIEKAKEFLGTTEAPKWYTICYE